MTDETIAWRQLAEQRDNPLRRCKKCGKVKPLDQFPINDGYRLRSCDECFKRHNRQRTSEYYTRNTERGRRRSKETRAKVFQKVMTRLGGKCVCCGETEPLFLTVDHIENDGAEHRKRDPSGRAAIYRWLIRHDFPPGYQLLCSNCNHGRYRNGGVCPHIKKVHPLSCEDVLTDATKRVQPSQLPFDLD